MTTMSISLPEALRDFVEQQVSVGGYSTASEYIRQLIRDDQKRAAQRRLEALLVEGIESGPPQEITQEWWQRKKTELIERLEGKAQP